MCVSSQSVVLTALTYMTVYKNMPQGVEEWMDEWIDEKRCACVFVE